VENERRPTDVAREGSDLSYLNVNNPTLALPPPSLKSHKDSEVILAVLCQRAYACRPVISNPRLVSSVRTVSLKLSWRGSFYAARRSSSWALLRS
jgi:hypothetical protein